MCDRGAPFFFKLCVIMHAGQRKVPHLTAKQPSLQPDVVDLSHHRRSPLLSMQVIVSSATLDASPISSTTYSVGNQAFLTFCKG